MATLFPPSQKMMKPIVVKVRALLCTGVHLAGFIAAILVMTWGIFGLLFFALGGFSLDGLMSQLYNLSSRYVTAGHERIASFRSIFIVVHIAVSGVLVILHRNRIFPDAREEGSMDHG